jgi:type IV pilus biogenesis protein CpaD/CtpE
MRSILIATVAVLLSGCAQLDLTGNRYHADYKSYDPCIKCGEPGWQQQPRPQFDAQIRYARGERW